MYICHVHFWEVSNLVKYDKPSLIIFHIHKITIPMGLKGSISNPQWPITAAIINAGTNTVTLFWAVIKDRLIAGSNVYRPSKFPFQCWAPNKAGIALYATLVALSPLYGYRHSNWVLEGYRVITGLLMHAHTGTYYATSFFLFDLGRSSTFPLKRPYRMACVKSSSHRV